MNATIVNLSLFKAGWLAAVFSAAANFPLAGAAAIGAAAAVHLLRSDQPRHELRLLVLAAVIGFVWESSLVSAGLVRYSTDTMLPGLAPYWIVAMWVLFATTLNVGMRWLRKSTAVASMAGAAGGPLSFLAGEKAGAVTFSHPTLALFVIGVGWAVFLPLLVNFAAREIEPTPAVT